MIDALQRIDVKQLLDAPANPDLDAFLLIFDRWRQRDDHPSDWVDLADYAHMPKGPGILIAGKRDTFSVNLNPPGPGLMTSVRKGLEGTLEDRFREAFRRARELNAAILAEPEFPGAFTVRRGGLPLRPPARPQFGPERPGCPPGSCRCARYRPGSACASLESRRQAGLFRAIAGSPVTGSTLAGSPEPIPRTGPRGPGGQKMNRSPICICSGPVPGTWVLFRS